MVDLHNKRCEHPECTARPLFNLIGQKRGRFCKAHKTIEMVDLHHKQCEHPECTSLNPVFNLIGQKRGRFCKKHKTDEMVDLHNKQCEHPECTSNPVFNLIGQKRGRFCKVHKTDEMVDLHHKQCEHLGCTTGASYGFPGHGVSYCAPHHPIGTMKAPNRHCCQCREIATHGITQPERCEAHSLNGDDNLVEHACVKCTLPNILNADGLCTDCAAWASGVRPRLAKQREVLQFLDHYMTEYPYDSTDTTPQSLKNCDRRERPDVMWDMGDRVVILEVDEDQHRDRPCECEQTRMMNISQAIGCERTVWIRYNPDAFKGDESRRWTSKAKRHGVLREWLVWALASTDPPPYTITVVHLFFDGFREGSVSIEKFL